MKGRLPEEKDGLDKEGRFFAYYDPAEFATILTSNGFTVDDQYVGKVLKDDGLLRTWLQYQVTVN
jgi:hypothetical protein